MEKNKSHEANLAKEHVSLLQREKERERARTRNPTFCCSPYAMGDQAASSPLWRESGCSAAAGEGEEKEEKEARGGARGRGWPAWGDAGGQGRPGAGRRRSG